MTAPKRPTDINQRAKYILDLALGNIVEPDPNEGKDIRAVELGKKGGKARAEKLTAEERTAIARKGGRPRKTTK